MKFERFNLNAFLILTNTDGGVYTLSELSTMIDKADITTLAAVKILQDAGLCEVDKRKGLYKINARMKLEILENESFSKAINEAYERKKQAMVMADEVIDYLNAKSDKFFRKNSTNRKHIIARLNEGFTVEQCKAVVDVKCEDWKYSSTFNKYLRPQTLFGGHFESYLYSKRKNQNDDELSKKMDTVMSAPVDDYDMPEHLDF